MKLAFMSSVFPKLTLAQLVQKAKDYGYAGLEFRPQWKHAHGVEVEASKAARAEIKMIMADSGIDPCSVSPGCKFCSLDKAERDQNFETLAKHIELARDTGIPRIRVFGDPLPNGGRGDRATSYARGPTGRGSGELTVGNYNTTLHRHGLDRQFRGGLRAIEVFGSRIGPAGALGPEAIRRRQRGE